MKMILQGERIYDLGGNRQEQEDKYLLKIGG